MRVVALVVRPTSGLLQNHYARHVVADTALDDFDAIVMEGGWNGDPSPGSARLRLEDATRFVRSGGVLIVCDMARNTTNQKLEAVLAASSLLRAVPNSKDGYPYYLQDDLARDAETGGFWFAPSEMQVDEWLRPAYDGVDAVLVIHPIYLLPGDAIAASGSGSTEVLFADVFEERNVMAPWASASTVGGGHVAVIGGSVTHDLLVGRSPGNADWISNLVTILTEKSADRMAWSRPLPPRTELTSVLEADESQRLERKSSFLASVDPKRPDIPKSVIQHSVGKSIVALANTDGGHLVIGQADDKTALGLDLDFQLLGGGKDSRDAFEQALAAFLVESLDPSWPSLGATCTWSSDQDNAVMVIHVPRSKKVVHLTAGRDKDAVYVRVLTTTRKLEGRDLTDWLLSRG